MKAKRWPVAVALSMGLSGCTFDQMGVCFDGGTSSSDANVILGLGCVAVVTTASLITYGVVAVVEAGDDDDRDESDDDGQSDESGDPYETYWIDTCRTGMTGGAPEKARMGWLYAGYRPDGDEADAYLWFRLAQADDAGNDDAISGLAKVESLLTETDRKHADAYARAWRLDPGRCEALYLGHKTRHAEPVIVEADAAADDIPDDSSPDPDALSCYGWRRMYDCRI